jgi:hypothetical protein
MWRERKWDALNPRQFDYRQKFGRLNCLWKMYDCYMKSTQYPLQVPDELMAEIESTAECVHLSKADVMLRSMKIGLPGLRKKLGRKMNRLTNVAPLPKSVLDRIYRKRDDDEDVIAKFFRAQSFSGKD